MRFTKSSVDASKKISQLSMIGLVCSLATALVQACPTCIGNLAIDTPPLFSKEYEKQYALYDDGTLEIAQTQESINETH